LPMLPPAAVLTAMMLRTLVAKLRRDPGARVLLRLHLVLVAVITVGVPVATMLLERDGFVESSPRWLSASVAIPLAIVGIGLAATTAWLAPKRGTAWLVAGTVVCTLFAANVFLFGYTNAREALSDLKPIAAAVRERVPAAQLYYVGDRMPPPDLLIYSGRIALPLAPTLEDADPPTGKAVLIVRQRSRQPDPRPPGNWQVLTKTRRDYSWWWAFYSDESSEQIVEDSS